MKVFRRPQRARLDLGKYEAAPTGPVPDVEAVVADGVLIALAGVRMSVKNHVIVAALRDGADYDPDAHSRFAAARLVASADRESASARQIRKRLDTGLLTDEETAEYERRETIYGRLADELRGKANDPGALGEILKAARYNALDEIVAQTAIRDALLHGAGRSPDRDYAVGRKSRIAVLLQVDLADLARSRGVPRV